jgi:His/Glu/Gln/Arg/opine family amino acid ABC transporter permease subunit
LHYISFSALSEWQSIEWRVRAELAKPGWFSLALAFFASSTAIVAQESARPLTWAADAEGGAPYIFKDPKNPRRNIGFEVDLTRALAEEIGRPIRFVQYDFKQLLSGLERGDFDLAMNGLEITPERALRIRFSKPYYAFRLQLVVRSGDEKRIQNLQGCKRMGGVVGTLEDTAAARYLDRRGIRKRIYDGQVEPYQDLEQRELDAVLLDLPIALYYARASMVTPRPPDFQFVGDIHGRGYYGIAFHKDNEALAQQFNAAIDRLTAKGILRRIYQKWGIWNESQEEFLWDVLWPIHLLGCMGGSFALVPCPAFLAMLPANQDQPRQEDFHETVGEDAEEPGGGFFMLLLEGAVTTIQLTFSGFALAVALGLPIALMRLYGSAPLRWFAVGYVEFFRGIPVLLLLAFLYYGLPAIARSYGLDEAGITLKMNALVAAIVGFGLNYAAYESEIYRSGIAAVPMGQWEAAYALGMSGPLTFRRIILPQAIRLIVPPMTNDLVALFKDTSVVSVVAVVELSKQYLILTKSSSAHLLEIALATAALYLVMSIPLGYLARHLERRWGVA